MRYGIAVILIIIFAIVGSVVILGRGGNNGDRKASSASKSTQLATYADKESASVSWTMQGRIVGEDQFRAVRVTVTRHTRTVEILNGYGDTIERKADYSNTTEAYQTFMRALDLANFGRERTVKIADERGMCPLGSRYIYRLQDANKEVMRTWSDSCLTADGPFAGNASLISQLFKNQIPDYSKFTTGVQF